MEENLSVNSENKGNKTKFPKSLLAGIIILTVLISVVFGSLFGFMAGGTANLLFPSLAKKFGKVIPQSQDLQTVKERIVQEDSAVTDVVAKSTPAVVSIIITKDVPKYRDFFGNPFFFFNPGQQQQGTEKQQIGGGSGFFVSSDGMIVTNRHVVADTQADYTVVSNDGKEYPAKLLARDPVRDIAVIKIDGDNFPVVTLGDSDSLKVGQTVIAIGNSLGEFANSVSKGIISGLQRNVTAGSGFGATEQLTNIIQTDAAINPGNSGGPLLDISGNVIGVNVAMAQGAENIGFALPINQVKRIINQVKTQGKISMPFLGVRYVIIDQAIKQQNNLSFDYGALVIRGQNVTDLAVVPGSPADKAGIVENDIILEISGTKVTQDNQLGDIISNYNVGDVLTLKVWHRGETKDAKVTLEERK
jgi:serine protease Do